MRKEEVGAASLVCINYDGFFANVRRTRREIVIARKIEKGREGRREEGERYPEPLSLKRAIPQSRGCCRDEVACYKVSPCRIQ